MALTIFPQPIVITNPDGSAVVTDPITPPATYMQSLAPVSIGGNVGVFGQPILTALLAALHAEGVIINTTVAPGTPGAAAGANAGTSPPAPVLTAGNNDERGTFTFGTGTSAAAGAQVVVTFGTTSFGSAPKVFLSPNNTATQALGLYVSARSATGFTISSTNAPASSQANTIFSADYLVRG